MTADTDSYLRSELSAIRREITQLREALPNNYIPRREFLVERQAIHDRLADLEAWQTWAVRLVLGAVVTAVGAALLTMGQAGADTPTYPLPTQETTTWQHR